MYKKSIIRKLTVVLAAVALLIAISASIQYFTAKNIQQHSTYADGTILRLYTQSHNSPTSNNTNYQYYVQYTFTSSAGTKYNDSYSISLQKYENLKVGEPISIYYDTMKPSVQAVAGYQSDPNSLGLLAVISILIALVMAVIFVATKQKNTRPKE